ncbi:MAG: hypothetical protein H5T49_02280 [Hadesarchaea archaeon]|nr:hypothetical protein [Hadesarchaea archaeon]
MGMEAMFTFKLVIVDWKNPVIQTLSIGTNIAAKKTGDGQLMFLIPLNLYRLKSKMGAAASAM